MKTATITYHNVYNYGAVLQAYALQQAQQKLSVENVIINFSHEKNKMLHRIKGTSIKIMIVDSIRLLETIKDYIPIRRRCRRFEAFTNTKLCLTRSYKTLQDLKENPPQADLYLAGSDQLWNVSIVIRAAFFLDFGSPETIRASYAVSMGSCYIPEQYKKIIKEYLTKFNVISVREMKAKETIEALLKQEGKIKVHCDPVFLLSKEEWSDLAVPRRSKDKYILCIPLAGHPRLNEALKKLKQLTGYRIVILKTDVFTRVKGDYAVKDASPEEYLYLIQYAEYVLTTSFHATAFSILFQVKFFSFLSCAATRITSLLENLGLEDRIVEGIGDVHTGNIDYTKANHILQEEKASAIEYLSGLFKR